MLDPRDPFERIYWHYDSKRPLSLAKLVSLGTVDGWTAGLVWLLLERRVSLILAGPTSEKPGVGKTTTLNALMQCFPDGTQLAYTIGMYEDFAVTKRPDIVPENTYVLCNELSDHQPFYMWGREARYYLNLPAQGFRLATTVHADKMEDVIYDFNKKLRVSAEAIRRLGLVIHVEVIGEEAETQYRRWLSAHFFDPNADPDRPDIVKYVQLAKWHPQEDIFSHADRSTLDALAEWVGMSAQEFEQAHQQRIDTLQALAEQPKVNMDQMYEAISKVRAR